MADRAERVTPTGPADGEQAARAFISYASQDKPVADAVCQALERAGVACWIAPRNVVPGESYAGAIVHAIDNTKLIVLILSEHGASSQHVLREVERASSKRHPLIAFRIDPSPMPADLEYFLNTSQWLDATTLGVERSMPRLVDAVQHVIDSPSQVGVGQRRATSLAERLPISRPVVRRAWLLVPALAVLLAVTYFTCYKLLPAKRSAAEQSAAASANVIGDKSIAVLPFADLSEKHDQEYFADGLAEEVLDILANIPGLRVISRTSSFQFKEKHEDLRTIASALGVSYLVEGSVRRSDERLRVTAQLISAQDGSHLWSNTYDEPVGDTLKVQDQIASNLARALQVSVGADYQRERTSCKNSQAHDLYLRGRHAYDRFDKEGLESAAAYFQQAIEIDSSCVAALEWLAAAQEESAGFGYVQAHEGFEGARRSAQGAVALDPKSSNAYAILSAVHSEYDWDWAAAERDAREALRLTPHHPDAMGTLGQVYEALGRWDEATRLFKSALSLDPLNADWYVQLTNVQVATGRLSDAEVSARKQLQISPTFGEGHYDLGVVLLLQGNLESSLAEMQHEQTESSRDVGLAIVYRALGRRGESEAALTRVVQRHAQDDAWEIADAYAYRGELDEAFAWLDRAYKQKDSGLYLIKSDPWFKNLRTDSRYKAFLRKMNLPE